MLPLNGVGCGPISVPGRRARVPSIEGGVLNKKGAGTRPTRGSAHLAHAGVAHYLIRSVTIS